MKFLRFFLPLCAVALGACQSMPYSTGIYTKFRVTNYRGDLVADWIAEGPYHAVGDGYEIKAVERTSGPHAACLKPMSIAARSKSLKRAGSR